MKKDIFIFLGVAVIFFSCSSPMEKKVSLDSFFFVDGSRGPACWLIEKPADPSSLERKMFCYDFANRKLISDFQFQNNSGDFYFPSRDSVGRGFFIQSGDRTWFLFDSNKLEARNIYTWEKLDDNKSFESKFPELKPGIRQLKRERLGMKGFDIVVNDGKEYFFDMEQQLMQPYEAWLAFVQKKEPKSYYYFDHHDPHLRYSSFVHTPTNPDTLYRNDQYVDTNKRYTNGVVLSSDERVTFVLNTDTIRKRSDLECFANNPPKLLWTVNISNEIGVISSHPEKLDIVIQNGKVLIQNYAGTHKAASYNLSDGKLLWSANADSLFKSVKNLPAN